MKKSLRANSWKLLQFQNCSHKSLTIKTIITCWRISNSKIINVSHLDFALKGWELQAYQGQGHRAKSWVISLSFFILSSFVICLVVLGFCICIGIHITRSLGKVLGNIITILYYLYHWPSAGMVLWTTTGLKTPVKLFKPSMASGYRTRL